VRNDAPRANQGRIPPPPGHREAPQGEPEAEHHVNGKINGNPARQPRPLVMGTTALTTSVFTLTIRLSTGASNILARRTATTSKRIDRDHHRFWFPGGFYFQVADWDWPMCADWCWDCGDDFVVYEDPDHLGWYMLYNVHTGVLCTCFLISDRKRTGSEPTFIP